MKHTDRQSFIVAEEPALLRDGIRSLCEANGRYHCLGSTEDGAVALRFVREHVPSFALIGMGIPQLYALELVQEVRREQIPTRLVVLSGRRDRKTVLEALRAGAHAFVTYSASGKGLLECVHQVLNGGIYVSPEVDLQSLFTPDGRLNANDPLAALSAREYQVFMMLVEGVRPKEIAGRLNLSPKTVDTYRSSLMRKLGIHEVAGLVRFAIQHGILSS
jgi:DNA-binding NarL/FixJ family response regulator